jgi:hypothetical protein
MATPDTLSGFAPLAGTWAGWGMNFVDGPRWWTVAAGISIIIGMLLDLAFSPAHRRRRWGMALAVPGLMVLSFVLRPELPLYPFHKLLVGFAPLCLLVGVLGWRQAAALAPRGIRGLLLALLVGAAGLVGWSSLRQHWQLLEKSAGADRSALDQLWAARARVAAHPDHTYLIATGNRLTGAWLAYFSRASVVYYDAAAMADRRVPSESVAFRQIPAGITLEWLDPVRLGPVLHYEPSPSFRLLHPHESFTLRDRNVYVVGAACQIELDRAVGYLPVERSYILECGVMPLPRVGPCVVRLSDPQGVKWETTVTQPTLLHLPLRAVAGQNRYLLDIRRAGDSSAPDANESLVILQQLSLERPAE